MQKRPLLNVVRLDPQNQWDQNMLERLFNNELFDTGFDYNWQIDFPEAEGIILIVPGQYYKDKTEEISNQLLQYKWVIGIVTGDEENLFNVNDITHMNIKWWIQTPKIGNTFIDKRVFGVGYPPHFNKLKEQDRNLDVFLSAQNTHKRRKEAFAVLKSYGGFKLIEQTQGFTQGMQPEEYAKNMARAKTAPAPSGVFSPDSFRLYEALEAHTVPIADDISPNYDSRGYWRTLFPNAPFTILEEYADLKPYIRNLVAGYPTNANRITAWWINQKREMVNWVKEDIADLTDGKVKPKYKTDVTAIVPISPIKSHPSTEIIDETIKSIRHHLPNSEIILMLDGVRPEQEDRREDYELFIQKILWKANHEYKNILPVIFEEHRHQVGMTRAVLDMIKTPLMLFVEQDTPLVIDEPIEIENCENFLLSGNGDMIRFHHEAVIPKEHKHMILEGYFDYMTSRFIRTCQWSQRPHLATVAFYRRILNTCFSEDAKSFIEDKMHGVCHETYLQDGKLGWEQYRLFIYAPIGGNIKRSYHTDGRAGEEKYDDTQVF